MTAHIQGALDTDETPSAERALQALEWAVDRSDTKAGELEASRVASRADFRVAVESYLPDVRGRLDRVMMSSDAETGLDALLACGALRAILPEVEALVGFGDGEWRH